jgi:intracellular sulfur oxidation DsrE/DsrF family protein
MKFKISLLLFCLTVSTIAIGQATDKKKPAVSKKDSLMLAKFAAKGIYPAIKASKLSAVLPVDGITEKPDINVKYKLLISLSLGSSEAEKVKELNRGLAEAGRIINLHLAAGVPKENLDVVIVTHGKALYALLNDEAFKKQFKGDNPNVAIVKELEGIGAKFIACGQAMQFLEIKNEQLMPEVKIAMSAKTALSTYQLKGYALYEIDEE